MSRQLYFQQPGVAKAKFERDHRQTVRSLLHAASGEARVSASPRGRRGNGASRRRAPTWITQADVDFYANEFRRAGFRGGLNWYRNIDKNWELLAPWIAQRSRFPRFTWQAIETWCVPRQ
jgi:hypothetical protein